MKLNYRSDIDGLRAISIILVVTYHAFPSILPGGFIGVDIFFVISGFLITNLLITSLKKDSFDLIGFYRRRINRIFPSLIVMLILSLIIGIFIFNPIEMHNFSKSLIYSTLFLSNYGSWKDAGYFDTSSEAKVLLNLWSLSVEEQFYILWPLILWILYRIKLLNVKILIFLTIISFLFNIYLLQINQSSAFYLPHARFWELIVGSLLSLKVYHGKNEFTDPGIITKDLIKNIQPIFGLTLIIMGSLTINNLSNFPGLLALVPVIGAYLIISSDSTAWINCKILSSKFLVYIGLISYPLYLYHWPLISFGFIIEGQTPSITYRIVAILLSIFLSFLSYRLLEIPIRKRGKDNIAPAVLIAITAVLLIISLIIFTKFTATTKTQSNIQNQIGWNGSQTDITCLRKYFTEASDVEFCRTKTESDPTILLMGDSMSFQLFFGLANKLAAGENVLSINQGNCATFLGVTSRNDYDQCERISQKSLQLALTSDSIHTIIISSAPLAYSANIRSINLGYGIQTISTQREFEEVLANNMRRILKMLLAKKKQVIFVPFNPQLPFDINYCLRNNTIKNCSMPKSKHIKNGEDYKRIVYSVLNDFPEVKIFNIDDLLCDLNNCYALIDDVLMYRDHWHLSTQGSMYVSHELYKLIDK